LSKKDKHGPVISFNANRCIKNLFIFLVSAEIIFFILDATINYGRWTSFGMFRRMFNTAREDGFASWFGTTQTLFVGLTVGLIWLIIKNFETTKLRKYGWLILTCFFLYMTVDDGVKIHERLGSAFKKYETQKSRQGETTLGKKALNFFPSYSWQVVFLPFFAAMGLFMLWFFWQEFDFRGRMAILAVIALWVTAVSMDFIEGLDKDHPLNAYTWIKNHIDLADFTRNTFKKRPYDTLRHFSKSIEECIEMLGMSILWVTCLRHLTQITNGFKVQFNDGK